MKQCMYETKICDICDLQKRLMQSLVDFGKNVIEAAIDHWRDRLRSCVLVADSDTLNTCYEIVVRLYYVVHENIL